jgi:hypothetical protein
MVAKLTNQPESGDFWKKNPRVGVGPPGERKEDIEVLVSSKLLGLQGSSQGNSNN